MGRLHGGFRDLAHQRVLFRRQFGLHQPDPGPRGIAVEFTNGALYVYDIDRPGAAHVAQMKRLAQAGRGLSTYISQQVRDQYAQRLR